MYSNNKNYQITFTYNFGVYFANWIDLATNQAATNSTQQWHM